MQEDSGLLKDIFSPIDLHFASFMEELSGRKDLNLFLASAILSYLNREGHICIDLGQLEGQRFPLDQESPSITCPRLRDWIKSLKGSDVVGEPGEFKPLVLDQNQRLYLYRYWRYEQGLVEYLKGRAKGVKDIDRIQRLKESVKRLFPQRSKDSIDWQVIGCIVAFLKRFCVITGGPGTGKTYLLSRIISLYLELKSKELNVVIATPTGKAAFRVQDSLSSSLPAIPLPEALKREFPKEAFTLHRLLGYRHGYTTFYHNRKNPLNVDLLIIDEASMVDLALFYKLLDALPEHSSLILLGDKDQLASVQPGSVLADICNAGQSNGFTAPFSKTLKEISGYDIQSIEDKNSISDCIVELKEYHRFGPKSGIYRISRKIKLGDLEGTMSLFRSPELSDVEFVPINSFKEVYEIIQKEVVSQYAPLYFKENPEELLKIITDFRILCATRIGPGGSSDLNSFIQEILKRKGIIRVEGRWYKGCPIIITRNDYNLQLFNGDLGILAKAEDGNLMAYFSTSEGGFRFYPPSILSSYELAYAITVHKSQGSEFDFVLLILPERDSPLLCKELIYTAITRAKRKVKILAHEDILRSALKRETKRVSGIEDALRSY